MKLSLEIADDGTNKPIRITMPVQKFLDTFGRADVDEDRKAVIMSFVNIFPSQIKQYDVTLSEDRESFTVLVTPVETRNRDNGPRKIQPSLTPEWMK